MKMTTWKHLTALLLSLLLLLTAGAALAAETPLSDFDYTLRDGRVVLTRYKGTDTAVHVAGSYVIDGASCGVTIDTATCFRNNTKITSATLSAGIRFATTVDGTLVSNSMQGLFQGCTALTEVDLTKISTAGVTDMSYLFSNCQKLKAVDFSSFDTSEVTTLTYLLDYCMDLTSLTGYENWDTGKVVNIYKTFNRVAYHYIDDSYHDIRPQLIDISRWDLSKVKNSGWCFQNCHVNAIRIPDNLAVISAGFFNHAAQLEVTSYTIPAGVKKIGYAHTFYDMGEALTELKVAPGNTHYKSVDGVLYSMDGTELLGVPRSKVFENNTFYIPEGVTFMGELSFSRNYGLKKIVLPNSYVIRQVIPENDPQYIVYEDNGNLNGGNSLYVALYVNTGVTSYGVKADNPRYAEHEDIIYSKDMTELVAIPVLYARAINVPEGATTWLPEAFIEYASSDGRLANCKSVSIPSTMVNIAPTQVARLNRTAKAYTAFRITVHPDNPVYYVDNKGLLQEGPNVYTAQITLDEDTFVYDGAPKTPTLSVKASDGTVLTQGTDYTVTYLDNVNAGTATVRITGMGDYPGLTEVTFTIQPKDIAGTPLRLLGQLTWNGEVQSQPFEVDLPDGAWTVTGNTARNVGVYRLTVQGKGNYTGAVSCLYEIAPAAGDVALLDTLTGGNVTAAHLPALERLRDMMRQADTTLADEATLARYEDILARCEALIALLASQVPPTGDDASPALYLTLALLSAALLLLTRRSARRAA